MERILIERAAPKSAPRAARARVGYAIAKRAFDILFSLTALLLLSPLYLIIAIAIKFERSGKRVFYRQKRVGHRGRTIHIYKFRSMVDDAENVRRWLNEAELKQYYEEYKVENDPRITKIGRFLRRTSLDELPQFWNVLKGDISLVGPRPIQREELKLYGKRSVDLLSVKPGLTGYWQAYCSSEVTYTNKKRQHMELYYIKHRSPLWDLKICFATAARMLRKIFKK